MATVRVNCNCKDVKSVLHGSRVGQFAANEVAKGADPYVPYRSGQLADSVSAEPFKVKYSAEYAKAVYKTDRRYNRTFHPKATARWGEAYAKEQGETLGHAVTRFLRSI